MDNNGIQERYTEDYAIMYRKQLMEGLPELATQINNMVAKLQRQNPTYVQALSQEQPNRLIDPTTEAVQRNSLNVKWDCPRCWSRYFRRPTNHSNQCEQILTIRKFALNIHQNNLDEN